MIPIKISLEGHLLGQAAYIFSDSRGEHYLYHFEAAEEMMVEQGSAILAEIHLDNGTEQNLYHTEQWHITQPLFIKSAFCVCVFADVIEVPDYSQYDQSVIDVLFFNDGPVHLMQYLKCQYSYNLACLRLNGISEQTLCDKNITLDCNTIHTKFMFYTQLAESLMGPKAYIGSNLDAFYDCLKHLTLQNCTLNLVNHKNLATLFTAQHLTYLMDNLKTHFNVNTL